MLRLAPEIVLTVLGALVMLGSPFFERPAGASQPKGANWLTAISIFGVVAALASTDFAAHNPGPAFSGLISANAFSTLLDWIILSAALLVLLGSAGYLERDNMAPGEFCAVILFAATGMCVMASATELVTIFIGLEISSIASYVLVGYRRDSPLSDEAAMKYFLLGSFATAFFLYGIALIYGASGTTRLDQISASHGGPVPALMPLGLGLVLVGLGFKVSAAPFQIWTPDVYQGAPAPVTALLSTGPKAAAFAVLLRIVASVDAASGVWMWALWTVAVLSMFGGNLAALAQSNLKRLLAYSSIAHAGYILAALAAAAAAASSGDPNLWIKGIAAALFYLAAYALMKLGAFLMIAHLSGPGEQRQELSDFAGLGTRQPIAAACLSLFLFSLLGLPITSGFVAKFYVFGAALSSHLVWLALAIAVNSIIGSYYYLRVIVVMYMREPQQETPRFPVPATAVVALLVAAVGTAFFGLMPAHLTDWAARAAASLR
ncbi:MAG: NADH-quinone oxidoreductase subunit N [Candidatus Acidiferrales bacterium]